ncbi:capon-like protein isoform X2 [Drosophila biarmipes]|uniref:capon-like protein isoform X2 n=1 Tax=Drosophila biarmipes TaxID=125945 RepID=UPI0007E71D47|nr:capon-like protein isoform X2 [Drosophila biarmipes]
MLISCKCSNFVASTSKLQRSNSGGGPGLANGYPGAGGTPIGEVPLSTLLSQVFQQKYPRDFVFYSQFMDFFKHAYGPIPDLTVAVINQRELLFGLTLDAAGQSWQLSLCINCKEVLCAKRLTAGAGATPTLYLINCTLLSSSEELAQRKSNKSYSETFELLIMDQTGAGDSQSLTSGISNSASSMSIGSLSANPTDARLQRLRMIQAHQQARLQEEILETNERIERYTRNQFQLLNSFREKSDQDCALLFRLIRALPEQASELLDRAMPPALDVAANQPQSATARRRNTISSRRELNGGPTTPTTTLNHPPSFLTLNQQPQQQLQSQQQQQQQHQQQQPLQQSVSVARKMSHFDTPPATPEATPMSVGNSPTFRQQSATSGGAGGLPTQMLATHGGGQSSAADDADDCLFDLEDVDAPAPPPVQSVPVPSYPRSLIYLQEHHDTSFRQMSQQNGLGGVLDDEAADEAEDALDPDSSISIPTRGGRGGRPSQAQLMNFAKSLPIEIANTTLAERAAAANNNNYALGGEEGMDNIDIAASIQALTKSVHGEAVFGDLPRPRLRSQIEG